MDPGAILIGLAILMVSAAYVLRPLTRPPASGRPGLQRRWSSLQAERDRILDRMREVDMDHAMGKIPENEYRAQRAELAAQGAAVLRRLDELAELDGAPARGGGLEAEIEAAVARLRRGTAAADKFCAQCGSPVVPGDRFCAKCGQPLAVSQLET